jgi:L-fuculose-phosphate aldolase
MSAHDLDLRTALIQTCRAMTAGGLSFGTSGNASVRLDSSRMLITPTGMAYESLQPDDIVEVSLSGHVRGRRRPSSEWRFHRDILAARTEINAVVHSHSPFATALACRGEGIPAFHYMVAVAGGPDIRCAPYATFGTEELSEHAVRALADRRACLLANHGQIALGTDLPAALKLAGEVETLAAQYWRACQGGTPILLDDAEMIRVAEKFRGYGDQSAPLDEGLVSDPD